MISDDDTLFNLSTDSDMLRNELAKYVLGYTRWPVLNDTGFNITPELIPGEINLGIEEHQNLQNYWKRIILGEDTEAHGIEHALIILVSPSTIDTTSISFDLSNIPIIQFNPGWPGLTLQQCNSAQKQHMPVLASGSHTIDFLRQFQHADKLKFYEDLIEDIAQLDETRKRTRSRAILVSKLKELTSQLQQITLVAKIINKGERLYYYIDAIP